MKLHRDKNKNKNKILKKQVGGDTRSNLKVAQQNQEEEQRLRKNPIQKKKKRLQKENGKQRKVWQTGIRKERVVVIVQQKKMQGKRVL